MEQLTPLERSTISRYLADSRGTADAFFSYAIYFVPSLLFGLYGMWKLDVIAVAVAYVVLFGLVVYLILHQRRSAPLFRSAIRKLVENNGATGEVAPGPASPPST
jgi:cytosine/uracil/thiamine/allantoin permease